MLYLTTLASSNSKKVLEQALNAFLSAANADQAPSVLYQLQYDQSGGPGDLQVEGSAITFPASSLSLAFDDSSLEPVHQAWKKVMGDAVADAEYMTFPDREGAMDDDDVYE